MKIEQMRFTVLEHLILDALKTVGLNVNEALGYMQEKLTQEEYDEIERFLTWLKDTKNTVGWGNFGAQWKTFEASKSPAGIVETWEQKQEREQVENKKKHMENSRLLVRVAKELKFDVVLREEEAVTFWRPESSIEIVNGNQHIFLRIGGYKNEGRIHVSPAYPRTAKGEYVDPYEYKEKHFDGITISIDKTVEQIAKAITTRFMPTYQRLLAKAMERINSSNDYAQKSVSNLVYIVGHDVDERATQENKETLNLFDGDGWGVVKVHGDSASLDLHSLPIETARKIVMLLEKEGVK